jgi:RNA polymerase sigma factor (sigma-70 family)
MDDSRVIELVRKAQSGDHAAYGQLVDLYGGAVLAMAYSRTGNYTVAQDIAQDAFLLGFENVGKLRQPDRFGLWLRTIGKNLCRDWQRSEMYRRKLSEDAAELRGFFGSLRGKRVDEEAERNETLSLVDEALRHLPVHDREVLLLYYFEGKSVAEAAEALDISAAAMKKRLERARKRLRDRLTARVETGLEEAAKGRKMSDRILAAIPLGASYAKVAPASAVLPGAPALTVGGILVKAGPTVIAYGKVAAIVVGICIAGGLYMTRENLSSRPPERAAIEPQQSISVQEEPVEAMEAAEEPPATEEPQPVMMADLVAGMVEESETPSISGTVRDADGNPLEGVHVEARMERDCEIFEAEFGAPMVACRTETGSDGGYQLGPLPSGKSVLIVVTDPDWAIGGRHEDALKESEHRQGVDIQLAHAETVSGVVMDEDGRPIEGAVVRAGNARDSAAYDLRRARRAGLAGLLNIPARFYGGIAKARTNADGVFTLTHLPTGSVVWPVTAEKPGYARGYAWNKESCEKAERFLRAGGPTPWLGLEFPVPCEDVTFVLHRGGSIRGRVSESSSGNPVENALVTVEGYVESPYQYGITSWSFIYSTRTDNAGLYTIADIPPVNIITKAVQGNLASSARELLIRPGEVCDGIDFDIARAGTIEGTVYDAQSDRPIANEGIQCFEKGAWGRAQGGRTDDNGNYVVHGLAPGEWEVQPPSSSGWRFSKLHHPDADERHGITVMVRTGQTTRDVDLYLERFVEKVGHVRGRVVDLAGTPVAGATVLVRPLRAVTDEQGQYELVPLKPGPYELIALDPRSMRYGTAHVIVGADEEAVVSIQLREQAGCVSGSVLDYEGQRVDPQVVVTIKVYSEELEFQPMPDESGAYTTGPVPPGTYTVSVRARGGYKVDPAEPLRIELDHGQEVADLNFVIAPMTGSVEGTVVYPDGTPAVGKGVFVGGREGLTRGMTDAQGRFSVDKIDGDDLYVQVGQAGRGFSSEGDQEWLYIGGVSAGSEELTLVLRPVGFLSGGVILAEGDAEPVRITIEGELGFVLEDHVRGGDGFFEVALQPDVYKVTVSSQRGSRTFERIVVESDMVTDLGEIELIPAEWEPAD